MIKAMEAYAALRGEQTSNYEMVKLTIIIDTLLMMKSHITSVSIKTDGEWRIIQGVDLLDDWPLKKWAKDSEMNCKEMIIAEQILIM